MSSVALARPLWPATLRTLRELTRLALAALVLAVGLGAAAADLPLRPAGDQPTRVAAVDHRAWSVAADLPAWPGTVTPVTEQVRASGVLATSHPQPTIPTAPPARPEPTAGSGLAGTTTVHQSAVPRPAVGHGEPTRRGPPAA
ncbi:hypothetical protein [Micromonospora craniellae]|uniref:Uncharacterized protein n=1 Tax=Micromonospora craniellae TaxID=2294034 RepID=A0A372FTB8_9ACTN|nr:hypothetical protein [Micromonospora craniellae]QOC93970.1 hypothetical protein ID554_10330 [Micromonospora craniellae]RFS44037.1 hypothetical protein D0Q02_24540 [Micromonospora craniellae]